MSVLTQFMPGSTKRQQAFTGSGTFTPSSGLLARGGWVEVLCVGGGGGGYSSGNVRTGGGGGAVVRRVVQVSAAVTVTIGAGGTGGSTPTAGGSTTFGALVSAAGGQPGSASTGGANGFGQPSHCSGGCGAGGPAPAMGRMEASASTLLVRAVVSPGGAGWDGYGRGGAGSTNVLYHGISDFSGPPNTGHGGTGTGAGCSGVCVVEWWE